MQLRPFYVRMTGKQIQEIWLREAAELELAAQICDEKAEATPEPQDLPELGDEIDGELISIGPTHRGVVGRPQPPLSYAQALPLPAYFKDEAIMCRETATDLRNFSKLINSEETFDLGREDLHALGLVPRCFRIPIHISPGLQEEIQKRRQQEH